jgi:hypothetical protein
MSHHTHYVTSYTLCHIIHTMSHHQFVALWFLPHRLSSFSLLLFFCFLTTLYYSFLLLYTTHFYYSILLIFTTLYYSFLLPELNCSLRKLFHQFGALCVLPHLLMSHHHTYYSFLLLYTTHFYYSILLIFTTLYYSFLLLYTTHFYYSILLIFTTGAQLQP